MRSASRVLIVAFVIAGCASADRPMVPTTSNAQLIRSLYEAFGRGDIPAVLGAFDQNVLWEEAENMPYADGNPYRGPQAVAGGVFQRLGTEWSGFRTNVQQIIDGGQSVVVLGRYEGTFKKTGKAVNAQFVHVWTLRDGKITKFQQFGDTAEFARVTGS